MSKTSIASADRRSAERTQPHVLRTGSTGRFERWAPLVVLCVLASAVLFWRLGSRSLIDWDEAIYAQVAKEMVQNGDWFTLHWGYRPWFEKPPLLIWSTAALFSIFGVSEFWARAASALSGIAVTALVFLIGRRIYQRTSIAFLAGIVLLTSPHFVHSSRFGTMDVMLTMFTFLAIYAYLRAKEDAPDWWFPVWVACALAVLTKSAAGVIAPIVIAAALVLDGRLTKTLRLRAFWGGLATAAVLVAGWHLGMYLVHGQAFLDVYFGRHLLERATTTLDGHAGGRDFYIRRLQSDFFPWVFLLPFAVAVGLRDSIGARTGARSILLVAAVVFGLYTLVQTKLEWYIVPMYPALALLVARTIWMAWRRPRSLAWPGFVVASFLLILYAPLELVPLLIGAGILLTGGILLRSRSLRVPDLALPMLAAFLVAGASTLPPRYRVGESDPARLARLAGESHAPGDTLLVLARRGLYRPTPLFYSDAPVEVAWSREQLETMLGFDRPRRVMIARDEVEALFPPDDVHVLYEVGPYVLAEIRRRSGP
jgi:4-amino-4-deoxy-L-arabinose transferase-like glycosyltransferase